MNTDCERPGGGLVFGTEVLFAAEVLLLQRESEVSPIEVQEEEGGAVTAALDLSGSAEKAVEEGVEKDQVPEEAKDKGLREDSLLAVTSVGLTLDDQLSKETERGERFTEPGVI